MTPRTFTRPVLPGEAHSDIDRVADMLEAAGYLDGNGRDGAQLLGPLLSTALRRYQAYRRLPITGVVDQATLDDLHTVERYDPLPDIPARALTGALGIPEGFVAGPTTWTTTRLRYCFLNDSADLSAEQSRAAIRWALKLWAEVVPIYFVEVSNNPAAGADIRIGFFMGEHGDGAPFDGPALPGDTKINFLAHGFFPPPFGGDYGGDLHFDDSETWTLAFRTDDKAQPKDLLTTALHEIGHCLGLDHSGNSLSVMYNAYTGSRRTLSLDDIRGMRSLYGSSSPVAPPPQPSGQSLLRGDFRRLDMAEGGVFANVFFRGGDDHLRQAFMHNDAGGKDTRLTIDHGLIIKGDPLLVRCENCVWYLWN